MEEQDNGAGWRDSGREKQDKGARWSGPSREEQNKGARWKGTQQLRHHYPGLCHACAGTPTQQQPLQRCAQCHLVMYCCRECQRSDWPLHRSFCLAHKVVGGQGVLETAAAAAAGDQQGSMASVRQRQQEFLGGQRVVASLALGRRLWPREAEALVYPRLCEVCGGVGEPGLCCEACHCVYYCSNQHQAADRARHSRWCAMYSLCVLCDFQHATADAPVLPPAVETEYRPLPASMTTHLAAVLGPEETSDHTTAAILSEQLTCPLTVLSVLQCTSPGLAKTRCLTLHLVGAEDHELFTAAAWEYLLHRLPCLTHLRVVMVGPRLVALRGQLQAPLCHKCRGGGRQVVIEGLQGLYHQYAAETFLGPPDLRVAFNCGFHEWAGSEEDTWPPSLALMMADDTPLAFTSFTRQEAERDLLAVRAAGGPSVVRVVVAGPNPYHSLRPLRDWTREDGQQLYHNSQYLTVVQASQPALA